ncbi:MAG: DUF4293 domain-containing protein [Bacteroidia bacterium]
MIQRIQSVYLLIVLLLWVSIFFLPVSIKTIEPNPALQILKPVSYRLDIYGVFKFEDKELVSKSPAYILSGLSVIGTISVALSLFLYKNRTRQIKLCRFSLLLAAAFIAADFYLSEAMGSEYPVESSVQYQAASYFPVLQIILLMMAIKAIKKDEDLVRAADRIR